MESEQYKLEVWLWEEAGRGLLKTNQWHYGKCIVESSMSNEISGPLKRYSEWVSFTLVTFRHHSLSLSILTT